jgi:NitT/TauT family transport system substrate-binding protein
MERQVARWVAVTVAMVALAVGAVPSTAAPQAIKIRYGLPTSPPVITTVGVYYALEQGFFRQEGLDVEVIPHRGSVTVVRALLSRQVDIVLTDPATMYLAHTSGAPLKIISAPVEKGTDALVAVSSINSVADLRGKRFGISEPGGQQHSQVRLLAAKHGLGPDDIQFLAIGGPTERAQALLLGRVDASTMTILILKPILEAIDAGRLKVLTHMGEEFPDLPTAYNLTTDEAIRTNPVAIGRFLRAEIRGYRWAAQNPDAAAQVAAKYIQAVDPPIMVRGVREIAKVYGLNGGVSASSVEGAQRLLVQLGVLRRAIDTSEVLAPQFVTEAVRVLGTR